jgi:flagellin-specific chaperone FliS
MKIYFCDICNESIPLEDLKSSHASTIKGKIFCTKCNPLNSIPSVPEKRVSMVLPLVLFAVATLLALGAGAHSWWVSTEVAAVPTYDRQVRLLEVSASSTQDKLEALTTAHQSLQASIARIEENTTQIATRGGEESRRLDRAEQVIRELQSVLDNVRGQRELLSQLEIASSQLQHSLAEVTGGLRNLEEQFADLRAAPPAVPADAGGVAVSMPAKSEFDEETRRYLADLKSSDASVRWTAVDRLAGKRDPALISALIPLLEDADAFVQFRVISALRELNARQAVGKLIALLRDVDAIVREEALETLVTLTGHTARFDVASGSSGEREKGVKNWEEWYKENRDRFGAEM